LKIAKVNNPSGWVSGGGVAGGFGLVLGWGSGWLFGQPQKIKHEIRVKAAPPAKQLHKVVKVL